MGCPFSIWVAGERSGWSMQGRKERSGCAHQQTAATAESSDDTKQQEQKAIVARPRTAAKADSSEGKGGEGRRQHVNKQRRAKVRGKEWRSRRASTSPNTPANGDFAIALA
eukprot:1788208-Pleurochrysis_carterae.AAC.1